MPCCAQTTQLGQRLDHVQVDVKYVIAGDAQAHEYQAAVQQCERAKRRIAAEDAARRKASALIAARGSRRRASGE